MKIQHIPGVAPLYTNTFLIVTDAGHGIIVDAAAAPQTYLDALQAEQAQLTHILLTHGHYDHVGAVAALRKATGCKVYMDPVDAAGNQMLPLTRDLVDENWPANGELSLRSKSTTHRGTRRAAYACFAGNCCSAVIHCFPVPAAVPISPAAVCSRCSRVFRCWQNFRFRIRFRYCRVMSLFLRWGVSAARTRI